MANPPEPVERSRLMHDTLSAMKMPTHALRKALSYKPYPVPQRATHVQLAMLHTRALRSLVDYRSCATEELQTFCQQRRLQIEDACLSKARLIKTLDKADEERPFHGFQNLTAELREYIFALYTQDFSKDNARGRVQSPLSQVSCLVRRQSLPLFYKTHVFSINVVDAEQIQQDDVDDLASQKCLDAKSEEWLSMTPEHYIKLIRHIRVRGAVDRRGQHYASSTVGIVFHIACTINVDARPGNRINLNRATRRLILLSPRFKRVSTRLSQAVDKMILGSIDKDQIRTFAEAFRD